jgi:hypothetical protein
MPRSEYFDTWTAFNRLAERERELGDRMAALPDITDPREFAAEQRELRALARELEGERLALQEQRKRGRVDVAVPRPASAG